MIDVVSLKKIYTNNVKGQTSEDVLMRYAKRGGIVRRLITALFILTVINLSAYAGTTKENILNSIQIDSLKDTYTITLNTMSEVDVKRTIQSQNNMILTVKNVKPAKSLNTIYKNAAEVDSVMVEPVGDKDLNISIQAKNISNSAITVEAEETELQAINNKSVIKPKKQKKEKGESITLSAPMDSYMPVYDEEIDEEDESGMGVATGLFAKIKEIFSQGNTSNIVTTGLIGLILFCGIKLFKKEEPETVVGLAQSLKEREINLYKDLSMRRQVAGPMSLERPASTLPIQNTQPIVNQPKPTINVNAGYGMRAYQASNKNPYMTTDIMTKKAVSPSQVAQAQVKQQPVQPRTMSTVGSRINVGMNRPIQNSTNTVAKASNIDSMKFLESMTKIYEKNGRADLAQGIKAGMFKAKSNR